MCVSFHFKITHIISSVCDDCLPQFDRGWGGEGNYNRAEKNLGFLS